jgi:uncharacterized alpha-E superfamily protein
MLSRMADALYWMARNLERAEDTARLIEINLLHLVEIEEADLGAAQWVPLLRITGSEGIFAQRHPHQEIRKDTVVPFLTQERAYASSIHQCIQLARENARVVRDRISQEMWECMNQMWLAVDTALRKPLTPAQAPDFYYQIRNRIARFRGLTQDTMVRGEAFGFNRLGTYMERTDMTARILDVKYHILLPSVDMVGSALDYYQWTALLKSLSGLEAYRLAYHAGLRPVDVSEFVIFSPVFPRSLRFGVDQLSQALHQIGFSSPETRTCQAMTHLCAAIEKNTADSIFEQGLHEFLQDILKRIAALNVALQTDCFQAHLLGENFALPDRP